MQCGQTRSLMNHDTRCTFSQGPTRRLSCREVRRFVLWPGGVPGARATQRFPLSSSWVRASLTSAQQAGLTVAACPWAPGQQLPHLHHLLGHLASFRETGGGRCPLGTDFCLHLLSLVCLLPLWMDSSLGILTTWHSSFAQGLIWSLRP